MKQICHNCGSEVKYKFFDRPGSVECKECHRLLFNPVKAWSIVWLLFSIAVAVAVTLIVWNIGKDEIYTIYVYLPFIAGGLTLAIISPFVTPFVSLIYRSKYR